MTPRPDHLVLGELITLLEAVPDKDRVLPLGFHRPHSYRGYYEDLAFEVTDNSPAVRDMLADAKSALGETFQGWKGGDYTADEYTPVWIVDEQGSCGETLGALLLHLLLDTA